MSDFYELTEKFKKFHHYDRIIGILDHSDYYKIATTVYDVLKNITTSFPMVKRENPKNARTSEAYRNMGNEAFGAKDYGSALQLYNLAILHAPPGSREQIFAYSNRSALLCKIQKYSSALIDIDRCIALKCHKDLLRKLDKRKEECQSMLWQEDIIHNNELGDFNDTKASEEFFKVSGKRNPKFPFAKNAVNTVLQEGKETVVAQSDIKLGEIIAIETAFVYSNLEQNKLLLCYNCNKGAYNMIPCDTCTQVLYCDKACRDQCWEEHHNIECAMIYIFTLVPLWDQVWLKYVFKTWNMTKDLKKFAEISEKIDDFLEGNGGPNKLEMDNHKTYLHPPAHNRLKKYGRLYDASIYAALIIHGLKAVPGSYYGKEKKDDVIKHMIKQFMYHTMHSPINVMSGAILELNEQDIMVESFENIGFFPFLSRCKNDCNPNTLTVGLGNRLALIASVPMKAGTELTIALGGCYGANPYHERQFNLYNIYSMLCECQACTEDWKDRPRIQQNCKAEFLEVLNCRFQWTNNKNVKYRLMCESMSAMYNDPTNKMYPLIYTMYRQLLSIYQHGVTKRLFEGRAHQLRIFELENIYDFMSYMFQRA